MLSKYALTMQHFRVLANVDCGSGVVFSILYLM